MKLKAIYNGGPYAPQGYLESVTIIGFVAVSDDSIPSAIYVDYNGHLRDSHIGHFTIVQDEPEIKTIISYTV